MRFYSTNHKSDSVPFREAVLSGLAPDGGLWMPERLPRMPETFFQRLPDLSMQEVAFEVSRLFVGDEITDPDLRAIASAAIDFDAPLVRLSGQLYALELFHGPTLAFKDFGARFMAQLVAHFIPERPAVILVATSGDTGSAIANAFHRMKGIRVVLLYPSGQVSAMQEQQMTTLGENVSCLKVMGSFDDCQNLVKQAFRDHQLKSELISANSINVARLIPQSFYYFYAYGRLTPEGPIVFSVPSGNFGNLTAGLFSKFMGLRVDRFIASTNVNDTVPDYLNSGVFTPRPSRQTISNAMDVGNPSNFARILELYDSDLTRIRQDIFGAGFTDDETRTAMEEVYRDYGYLCDPHTAVAYLGWKSFPKTDQTTCIVLSTAHPAKFGDVIGRDVEIPDRLQRCLDQPKRFTVMKNDFTEFKDYLTSLDD